MGSKGRNAPGSRSASLSSTAAHERAPWLARIDGFLAPAILEAGGDPLARGRLVVGTALIGAALLIFFAIPTSLLLGQPGVALINGVSASLFFVSLALLRATGSVTVAANYLVGLGWMSMVAVYVGSGQSNLSALYSMAILPLAAMLLGGVRAGIAWTIFTCASAYAVTNTGVGAIPAPFLVSMKNSSAGMARDVILQTIWVMLFAGLYDRLRSHATREARDATGRAAESEERFGRVFASSPQSLAIWNVENGTLAECNDVFLQTAGVVREAVVGQLQWVEYLGVDLEERRRLIAAMTGNPDRCAEFEVTFPVSNGDDDFVARDFLVSAAFIDFDGSRCVLTSAHDITLRKQLDRRLQQTQKMEAIGQMAGSIAHDFNNMLTVITGYSSQLMRELPGEAGEILGEIHNAAQRSAGLTRQLLAFSRQQVVQAEVMDLNSLVENLDRILERVLGEDIELHYELSPYETLVRVDSGQLEQMIINLAINSRDAMPDGGRLTIAIESGLELPALGDRHCEFAHEREGRWAAVRVRDTGHGMDESTLARATEPFFTTKGTGHGTGLGLSTAHGIVGQCGGELVVESEPGRGTTVTAWFPLIESDASFDEDPREEPKTPSYAPHGRTVLLVEDEEMVRRIAKQTLELSGLEVLEASNGREGLEIARSREGEIDLVVSDIMMPEMSGLAFVKTLLEEQPEVAVLFMSGYPDTRETPAGHIPDSVEMIEKPFSPSALEARIVAILDARKKS